ncbi:MAG: tyrosine-type recombinase/integrase [Gallionellaceae bacterium]
MVKIYPVPVPRKIPLVLSRREVARLIGAAGNLKNQAALSVAYGAGLRVSEVVALKVGDIDSQRMALRIEQGKGHKDRYAMLSPVLLECLRTWWRTALPRGRCSMVTGWFPVRIRSMRSVPVNSIRSCMPPQTQRESAPQASQLQRKSP